MVVAVQSLVRLQQDALRYTSTGDSHSVLYCWAGHGLTYVGFSKNVRASRFQHGGVIDRWLEHASLRMRRGLDCNFLRYRLARRLPPRSITFIVLRTGDASSMRAAESVAIRSLRPNGNSRPAVPTCTPAAPRCIRRRPLPHLRDRTRADPPGGLFDVIGPRAIATAPSCASRRIVGPRSAAPGRWPPTLGGGCAEFGTLAARRITLH